MAWERSRLERAWSEQARAHGPIAAQANRNLDAVVALFQAAKRYVERGLDADPGAFVRGILDTAVAEDRLDSPVPDQAVRILTPAGALGLEFDTVIVAGVQDGVWPNTRLRGSLLDTWRLSDAASRDAGDTTPPGILDRRRSAMHDELRLFVRALSRATRELVVTAVDDDDTGPSVFFEFLPDALPATRAMEHPLSLRGLVALHRRTLTDPAARGRTRAAGQLALLADAGVAGRCARGVVRDRAADLDGAAARSAPGGRPGVAVAAAHPRGVRAELGDRRPRRRPGRHHRGPRHDHPRGPRALRWSPMRRRCGPRSRRGGVS